MKLTLRQLKLFEAMARYQSFTRTATAMHLTQPAVSMQIKQLEDTIGLPLVEQVGKKIYLTDAGRELHTFSWRMLALLGELEDVVEALKGTQRGHLKVSVATTANRFATRLLAAFAKRHAGITFSLDVTNRQVLLHQLEHNERDLVIMGQPPDDVELTAEAFLTNLLVVIAPADHPLVGQLQIAPAQLARERILVREEGSGTRSAVMRFFTDHDLALPISMEMSSNEVIKQAVEAGLGLAIVSMHTLEIELQARRLAVLNVAGFPIERHWYLVQRQGKRLSPVAQAFREFVLAEAKHVQNLSASTPSGP